MSQFLGPIEEVRPNTLVLSAYLHSQINAIDMLQTVQSVGQQTCFDPMEGMYPNPDSMSLSHPLYILIQKL